MSNELSEEFFTNYKKTILYYHDKLKQIDCLDNSIKDLTKDKKLKISNFEKKAWVTCYLISCSLFILLFKSTADILSSILVSATISILITPFLFIFSSLFLPKEIKDMVEQIENTKNEIKNLQQDNWENIYNIKKFEDLISKYCINTLEEFYQKNLYRKKSEGEEFKKYISIFYSQVMSVKNLNKKFIVTQIPIYKYLKYIEKRGYSDIKHDISSGYSHPVKLISNQLNSNYISQIKQEYTPPEKLYKKLKTVEDGEKRTDTKPLYVDSKTPDIAPVNTLLKKIGSTKTTPPEYLYKNFRPIYNCSWDEINKNKTETGIKGEYVAFYLEKYFLEAIGKKDLADKVRHVSVEDGDGMGYDILSFFHNGNEKYIEVKSTTGNATTPFYMSQNELNFIKSHHSNAVIYRVLITENEPKLKVYSSEEVLTQFDITPSQYKVKPRF